MSNATITRVTLTAHAKGRTITLHAPTSREALDRLDTFLNAMIERGNTGEQFHGLHDLLDALDYANADNLDSRGPFYGATLPGGGWATFSAEVTFS